MLIDHLCISLGEMSVQVQRCPFLHLLIWVFLQLSYSVIFKAYLNCLEIIKQNEVLRISSEPWYFGEENLTVILSHHFPLVEGKKGD